MLPGARSKKREHWSARYIGLPYAEADCAQLCVRVQREVFGREIALPSDRADGIRGISKQISTLRADHAQPVAVPEEGDAVLMIGRGQLNHIGLLCMINGQAWVLHAMRNVGHAVLHRVSALENQGLVIEGYYRWL